MSDPASITLSNGAIVKVGDVVPATRVPCRDRHFWAWNSCDGTFCEYVCMDCGDAAKEPYILNEEKDYE